MFSGSSKGLQGSIRLLHKVSDSVKGSEDL